MILFQTINLIFILLIDLIVSAINRTLQTIIEHFRKPRISVKLVQKITI